MQKNERGEIVVPANTENFKMTKYACYVSYLAMASVFGLPPILFMTFREMYGISYTLLGTLVLVNFCCQLTIDLIFTFFSKHFNIHKTIRVMPLLTCLGLLIYAIMPALFPGYAYIGLLLGTVIFSVSAGLCEVLLSPLVAALPSDNSERDMSLLHSLYAYGLVTVIIISTVFIKFFGSENWMYLAVFWALFPVVSFVLFCVSPLPEMNISHGAENHSVKGRNIGIALCVVCIFLGGAAETAMTNWISGYMETALRISKTVGDILGMAVFAVLLALGRTLYAKYGKNIFSVLLFSMAGAAACYLVAGTVPNSVISMLACVLTGLFTSMLWPGTLILLEEKYPNSGITAYALLAAGGDLGDSIAPQILGIVVDKVSASAWAVRFSEMSSLSAEQIGMKAGMLTAALFPLLGVAVLLYMKKYFNKRYQSKNISAI